MKKPVDTLRAKKRRTDKVAQNLNALQVVVLTKPLTLNKLDLLLEITDLALRLSQIEEVTFEDA